MGWLKPKMPASVEQPKVPTVAEIVAAMPEPAKPDPPPNPATMADAATSIASQAAFSRRGGNRRSSTIMTSGQGVGSAGPTTGKTLLGM